MSTLLKNSYSSNIQSTVKKWASKYSLQSSTDILSYPRFTYTPNQNKIVRYNDLISGLIVTVLGEAKYKQVKEKNFAAVIVAKPIRFGTTLSEQFEEFLYKFTRDSLEVSKERLNLSYALFFRRISVPKVPEKYINTTLFSVANAASYGSTSFQQLFGLHYTKHNPFGKSIINVKQSTLEDEFPERDLISNYNVLVVTLNDKKAVILGNYGNILKTVVLYTKTYDKDLIDACAKYSKAIFATTLTDKESLESIIVHQLKLVRNMEIPLQAPHIAMLGPFTEGITVL